MLFCCGFIEPFYLLFISWAFFIVLLTFLRTIKTNLVQLICWCWIPKNSASCHKPPEAFMCACMYLFIDLGDTNSVSSHFWGQFLRSFSFLPLFLYLLGKEMIPAYRKLKRSVMDVRRSLASYSNNINSSWPRLLQKHNVSLSILLHIWQNVKCLQCFTVKLRKLSTPKNFRNADC